MPPAPEPSTNAAEFLQEIQGRYVYRTWLRRVSLVSFLLIAVSGPLMGIELLTDPPTSAHERSELIFGVICAPFLAWMFFIQCRKLREIVIDSTGLRIEPLGLYIAADQIEEISWAEKYTGKGGHLKIKLKEPRLLLYPGGWSLGDTATVVFNPQVLRTEQST